MDEQVEEDDIVEVLGTSYRISAAVIKVEKLLSASRDQKIEIVKVPTAMVAKVLDVGLHFPLKKFYMIKNVYLIRCLILTMFKTARDELRRISVT